MSGPHGVRRGASRIRADSVRQDMRLDANLDEHAWIVHGSQVSTQSRGIGGTQGEFGPRRLFVEGGGQEGRRTCRHGGHSSRALAECPLDDPFIRSLGIVYGMRLCVVMEQPHRPLATSACRSSSRRLARSRRAAGQARRGASSRPARGRAAPTSVGRCAAGASGRFQPSAPLRERIWLVRACRRSLFSALLWFCGWTPAGLSFFSLLFHPLRGTGMTRLRGRESSAQFASNMLVYLLEVETNRWREADRGRTAADHCAACVMACRQRRATAAVPGQALLFNSVVCCTHIRYSDELTRCRRHGFSGHFKWATSKFGACLREELGVGNGVQVCFLAHM